MDFSKLGIAPKLLQILHRLHFTEPTPIQAKAIPVAVEGNDVVGIAQTGTGKTLAFAVPLLQRIARSKTTGLVIAPTRELALQIDESFTQLGSTLGLRRAVLIGGASMPQQIQALRKRPHVVIGTPGRIIDHLNQKTVDFKTVSVLVLDEADRMLDMGFAPQIKRILAVVPRERQTLLFSATMPADIMKIAAQHMRMPVRIEVAPAGTISERVEQELVMVEKPDKPHVLDQLLEKYKGTVLVFSRTKYGAKKLARAVRAMGHSAAEIHSNLSLPQRRKALEGFRSNKHRVLVATDIAARGIDVKNIELVVNYDLPDNPEDYVHRIGRTGRAGRPGRAITFITPDQRSKVRIIERMAKGPLKVSQASRASGPRVAQPPHPTRHTRRQPSRRRARVHF